jgi:uncharacterized membrane protein YcaP (DUF421 family)
MSSAVLIEVAWHTLIVYVFLIVAIRLIGKRALTQISVTDLIAILLLGSAVETAMVAANTSIRAGIVSASVLLAANFCMTRLMLRSKRFRHLVNGGPVLLIHNGKMIQEQLWRSGLTEADVKQAMREREIGTVPEVKFAVLEPDGRINFVRRHS